MNSLFLKCYAILLAVLVIPNECRWIRTSVSRQKRQTNTLRQLLCQRNRNSHFCRGVAAPRTVGPPLVTIVPPTTTTVTVDERRKLYCRKYKNPFESKCHSGSVTASFGEFCRSYARECGRRFRGKIEEPSKPKSKNGGSRIVEFCRTFTSQFRGHCPPAGASDANVVQFCADYTKLCTQRPPTVSRGKPSPNRARVPTQRKSSDELLKEKCLEFEGHAEKNCLFGTLDVDAETKEQCRVYLAQCDRFIYENKPLKRVANLFNSEVGFNQGFAVTGIPYYPFNKDGAVGIDKDQKINFGTRGGGYSETAGVRDFFQSGQEIGGNWYTGKYGAKSNWEIPILPWINGGGGTMVDAPFADGQLGKPVNVNTGYGVGDFFGINDGTSVDWLNGDVSNGKSWGLPFLGIGGSAKTGIRFPSVSDFADVSKLGMNAERDN